MSASHEESQGPVIRDRRRIDPVTGQVRQPEPEPRAAAAGQVPPGGGAQPRPGRHAVSKPGSQPGEGAADPAAPSPAQTSPGQTSADEAGSDQAGAGQGDTGQPGTDQTSSGQGDTGQPGTDQTSPGQGGADQPGEGQGDAGQGQASPGGDGSGPTGTANGTDGDKSGRSGANGGDLAQKLAERTADLQRLQAEYSNYRKRVDRDRAAVREMSVASVLGELLPVLDDIGRAREHGELTGGFKSVAESLESAVTKLGLTTYGKAGEPFDPNVHEALMHSYSADVDETTCVQVLQPGYKVGERILRPARVAVAEPTGPGEPPPASSSPDDSD